MQVTVPRSRLPLKVHNLRVNNVEIPNGKRVEISLQYIYGIGQTTAKAILRDTVRGSTGSGDGRLADTCSSMGGGSSSQSGDGSTSISGGSSHSHAKLHGGHGNPLYGRIDVVAPPLSNTAGSPERQQSAVALAATVAQTAAVAAAAASCKQQLMKLHTCAQGVENKKTYELNEEDINKLREEVGKYTTEADLVSTHTQAACLLC